MPAVLSKLADRSWAVKNGTEVSFHLPKSVYASQEEAEVAAQLFLKHLGEGASGYVEGEAKSY
jgi:hypothetical protein